MLNKNQVVSRGFTWSCIVVTQTGKWYTMYNTRNTLVPVCSLQQSFTVTPTLPEPWDCPSFVSVCLGLTSAEIFKKKFFLELQEINITLQWQHIHTHGETNFGDTIQSVLGCDNFYAFQVQLKNPL